MCEAVLRRVAVMMGGAVMWAIGRFDPTPPDIGRFINLTDEDLL